MANINVEFGQYIPSMVVWYQLFSVLKLEGIIADTYTVDGMVKVERFPAPKIQEKK
jgi:hypothetical protein